MPTLPDRRPGPLRPSISLFLAVAFVALAAAEAPAQLFQGLTGRNQRFYGPEYNPRGYADSLGLRGHNRLENGGYYGPPQIYSRQYGTIHGYRTERPFTPLRSIGGAGYDGATYGTSGYLGGNNLE